MTIEIHDRYLQRSLWEVWQVFVLCDFVLLAIMLPVSATALSRLAFLERCEIRLDKRLKLGSIVGKLQINVIHAITGT